MERHTASIMATIINHAGMTRPKTPVEPEDLLEGRGSSGMSRERYEKNKQRHFEQIRYLQAKKQRAADPTVPDLD